MNAAMLQFLNLFDVEEVHGLSPFCRKISPKEELVASVKYFFPSKMLDQSNRDSSEENESGEDSDGNGLIHKT